MPTLARGSLTDQTYINLVAYILQANGISPGTASLTPTARWSSGSFHPLLRHPNLHNRPHGSRVRSNQQTPNTPFGRTDGLWVAGTVEPYVPVTEDLLRQPTG